MGDSSQNHRQWVVPVLCFTAASLWIFHLSQVRFIDGDEGFYTYAAKLILNGSSLYTDFFYPQMPLLPIIYGGWCWIFGTTWEAARALSAFLTFGSIALLYWHLRRTISESAACMGTVLCATSALFVLWSTTVKTFPLTIFFLVLSFVLISSRESTLSRWRLLVAGTALGLAISSRLMVAPLAPLFALFVMCNGGNRRQRLQAIGWFALGGFLGLLPSLWHAVISWEHFLYNNLGYHQERSTLSPEREAIQRWQIFADLIGLDRSREVDPVQIPLLYWTTVAYALHSAIRRSVPDRACAVVAALTIINLIPVPTYHQYTAVVVPFLVLCTLHWMRMLLQIYRSRTLVMIGIFLWSAAYLYRLPGEYLRYTRLGGYEIGNRHVADPARNTIDATQGISRVIDALTEPGEYIAGVWPGHLFQSHAFMLHGFENHFGWRAAEDLTGEEQNRYRVALFHVMLSALKERVVRVFVGNTASRAGRIPLERLHEQELVELVKFGPLRVLVARELRDQYTQRLLAKLPHLADDLRASELRNTTIGADDPEG